MAIQIVYKAAEVKLMETLNDIQEPFGWAAVHFHLSDLLEQYKSEYQIKIAINLIHDLLKSYMGGIFLLADQSIIMMCYRLEKAVQNKLIFQLRYLYMDDPLAYTETGQENPDFCTVYDLENDWHEFFDLCTRRMAMAGRRAQGTAPAAAPSDKMSSAYPVRQPKKPVLEKPELPVAPAGLSASRLASIERDLKHADLRKVIRRQPVCTSMPNMPVRRVFDELYIHIAHLRQMLKSDVDFLSNRWLFKYLTQTLDERVIELVGQNPGQYLDSPISINLNVETLLSSAFAEFDASLKAATKVSIVIEIPIVDVFADMAAFIYARQEVQKLGYRVCLDGLTTRSFSSVDREKLGVDLIKVQWNADVAGDLETKENRELFNAVKTTGSNRVILCRCDNQQAVQYGQAMGISLFQGRHLDALLNPTATVEN
jgi:EAL domain-containing protein (putative c-di-GMP-specific phosphodiesterase class I)